MDSQRVTAALTRAVRDHGRLATTQPERIRALLSDLLGSAARDLRAEVDAVVVACEEGVPHLLLSATGPGLGWGSGLGPDSGTGSAEEARDGAVAEALRRLEDRGLRAELAVVAVSAWAAALDVPLGAATSLAGTAPHEVSSASAGGVLSSSEEGPATPSDGRSASRSFSRSATDDHGSRPRAATVDAPGDAGTLEATVLPVGATAFPAGVETLSGRPTPAAGATSLPAASPATDPTPPPDRHLRRTSARTRTVVGAAGAAAVLVAGVAGASALWPDAAGGPDGSSTGSTLLLLSTVPVTPDPMATTDSGLRLLMNRALYRGLLAFAPSVDDRPAALVPDLATSTGTTPDGGRTWTWTLTDTGRWEDGRPVTCADAKAGWARAFAAAQYRSHSYRATRLVDVPLDRSGLPVFTGTAQSPGATAFDSAVSCSGADLTIRLARANLDFPRYLALPELAPYRQTSADGGDRALASGPYRVETASPNGAALVLARNSHWTGDADRLRPAHPDRIEVIGKLALSDITARLQADAGSDRRAASLQSLPPSADSGFRDSPDRTQIAPNGTIEVLSPNFSSAIMQDKRIRQALALSLDRPTYVRAMGGPATRIALHSLAGAHRNGADAQTDPAKAKALLAGRHPVVRVLYHGGNEADVALAGLAAGWEAVGFTVQLTPFTGTATEYSRHLSKVSGTDQYDLVRANPVVYLDPADNVAEYDSRVGTRWLARGYKSSAVTTAIDRARTTADPAARTTAWNLVHSLATADAVMLPLASRVAFVGYGSEVRDARTLNEYAGVLDTALISLTTEDRK